MLTKDSKAGAAAYGSFPSALKVSTSMVPRSALTVRTRILWAILRSVIAAALHIVFPEVVGLAMERQRSLQNAQVPGVSDTMGSRISIWRHRVATLAVGSLALVMAYGVVFGHNGLTAFAAKRREAKALQAQTQQLQKENERLHGHVDRLKNDPSAIEHEARQQFHYTRPGEVIYTLPAARAADVR